MPDFYRSPTMRLDTKVRCHHPQPPPWQDGWAIEMDATTLVELSAELLALPDPLPPHLRLIRFLTESVISRGLESRQADWRSPLATRYPGGPDQEG